MFTTLALRFYERSPKTVFSGVCVFVVEGPMINVFLSIFGRSELVRYKLRLQRARMISREEKLLLSFEAA